MNMREKVLNTAREAVCGDRQLNYGKPEANFERIANLWNAWLRGRGLLDKRRVDSIDVAALLVLVKVARLENSPDHFDSWVDIAGYAACGAEVVDAIQGGDAQ